MRQPAAMHPELLVVTGRFDDQRIAFPAAARVTEVRRDQVGIVHLRQRPAVEIDEAPAARTAAEDDGDALAIGLLDELEAVRRLELAGPARRQAARMRIVLFAAPQPRPLQSPCPPPGREPPPPGGGR